ncbi:MAG: hypothetical protein KF830_18120 [Planctomycetes bacterium]|nr:hypothetical protein [Planctomycetota bacterium]
MPRPAAAGLADRAGGVWLVAATLGVLWPCLLGGYLGDDVRLIERNPALRAGDLPALLTTPLFGGEQGYWRPLLLLVLYVGDRCGGPFGVHALALLLHLANVLLVRALAARLVPPVAAFWVALGFAVHPVQVETVGWCAAANDLLWATAALVAVWAAVRWRERGGQGVPWATAAGVVLALAAKETGIAAVPLVLAALAWLPAADAGAPRHPVAWRRLLATLAAGVAGWLVLRAVVLGEPPGQVLLGGGASLGPRLGDLWRGPELLLSQLVLLVWPLPVLAVRSVPPWPPAAAAAAAAALALAAGLLVRCRRRVRPGIWLGLAFVLAPVLPTVAYQRAIGSYPIADRYLYLCVVGAGLLLAQVPAWWRTNWLPWVVVAAAAVVSFVATWNWHDAERFTAHAERHAPDDPMVLVMAADLQLQRAFDGDVWARSEAERRYRRALAVLGDDAEGSQRRQSLGVARLGLAWCALLRGERGAEAEAAVLAAFQLAVETAPQNASAWYGLGVASGELRRFAAAAAAFEQALRLDPELAPARRGLARLQELGGPR